MPSTHRGYAPSGMVVPAEVSVNSPLLLRLPYNVSVAYAEASDVPCAAERSESVQRTAGCRVQARAAFALTKPC